MATKDGSNRHSWVEVAPRDVCCGINCARQLKFGKLHERVRDGTVAHDKKNVPSTTSAIPLPHAA